MTFFVTLIALLIERFFDWSHLRRWQWFTVLLNKIATRMNNQSPFVVLATVIFPMILILMIMEIFLRGWLYGLLSLIFQLVVLLYCLGPGNLWADLFAQINTFKPKDNYTQPTEIKNGDAKTQFQQIFLNNIFVEANRRVFAPIFWFVLFGPAGVVLYRTISLTAHVDITNVSGAARSIEGVLDWLPIRLFTFLFALGGHFVQVLSAWRKYALFGIEQNEVLLSECGVAALGTHQTMLNENEEKNAMHLLDRVFIISLAIIGVVNLLI